MSELIEINRIRELIRDVVFDKGNKASIIGNGCFCAEKIVNSAYEQGRADAERDFQNSDYWNEYLAKVLADARADAFKEFVESYREFCITSPNESCLKEDIECEGMCIDCFEKWFKEKEQK